MKVLLYTEGLELVKKSGVGKAISHQMKALDSAGVAYTTDPKDSYDIIHINTIGPNSWRLAREARRKGKKVVIHAHSTEEDFRNSFIGSNLVAPLFKKWLISCYTAGDCIVTPTPYSKKLLENYGIKQKIYPVSNGIELEFFKKNEKAGEKFRKYYGFSSSDKIVMSVGLYIERKGILDFVKLAKRFPEYQFIWFGHTPLYTVPANIRQAVRTKLPNLHFPGYVESKILRAAYSGADLFLFMTHEETEGIVLLEALANEQKVLIRDIPIYEGWFKDKENVYKAADLKGFARGLKGILENRWPDLTKEGYKVAEERSIEAIGSELKRIYTDLYES